MFNKPYLWNYTQPGKSNKTIQYNIYFPEMVVASTLGNRNTCNFFYIIYRKF